VDQIPGHEARGADAVVYTTRAEKRRTKLRRASKRGRAGKRETYRVGPRTHGRLDRGEGAITGHHHSQDMRGVILWLTELHRQSWR
jgi:hypothetical protein